MVALLGMYEDDVATLGAAGRAAERRQRGGAAGFTRVSWAALRAEASGG